jgi:hypothetical protein
VAAESPSELARPVRKRPERMKGLTIDIPASLYRRYKLPAMRWTKPEKCEEDEATFATEEPTCRRPNA